MEAVAALPAEWIGLGGIGVLLFVASTIGYLRSGPERWVKIGVALLVADCVLLRGLAASWSSAVGLVGLGAGGLFVGLGLVMLTWRHPITKVFSPATRHDCPAHGVDRLERWTLDLEALGFVITAEKRTVWQVQGTDRVTYIRFLAHHSEPIWVEIHVLADPKVAARMALSDAGDGRAIMTCDKQADPEFFEDPGTTLHRVPSGSTCRDLVDTHRKLAMTTEGRVTRVEDPVEAHAELYGAWVQRLLATHQVREEDGHSIALPPRSIPGLILRAWSAWFH